MTEQTVMNWNFIFYGLIVVGYFEAVRRMSRRHAARRVYSDEEYLMVLARNRNTSEYDLFHSSAENWPVSRQQIAQDFNRYLNGEPMPFYVRDYIRRIRREGPLRLMNPLHHPFQR